MLTNVSQHVPIYLQQFTSYSNRKCKKYPFSRTAAHIFVFIWRRPCDYHPIFPMDEKRVGCLPNPSQHVPIYLEYFPSYMMLKWMRKCKNSYFYHIFVSPGDSLVVITLNVILMKSELGTDGHRMPAPMHTHVAHAVSATAVYWWENLAAINVREKFRVVRSNRMLQRAMNVYKDHCL